MNSKKWRLSALLLVVATFLWWLYDNWGVTGKGQQIVGTVIFLLILVALVLIVYTSRNDLGEKWGKVWGDNAIVGQLIMVGVGAITMVCSIVVLHISIDGKLYCTLCAFLIFIPLPIPALGIDPKEESMPKFILTFGTSSVFGGLPGLLIVSMFKGGDEMGLASPSAIVAIIMVLAMYLSYFQVGHLSRDFLYRSTGALKNANLYPKTLAVLLGAISRGRGCLVRKIWVGLLNCRVSDVLGKNWPDQVDSGSLWAKLAGENEDNLRGSPRLDQLLGQAALLAAQREICETALAALKDLLKNPLFINTASPKEVREAEEQIVRLERVLAIQAK